jgi:hypothetical protein
MEEKGTPAGEEELILAVAGGAGVREAAEQAGVDERTARRRLADADFRRAVSQARGRMFDAARGRLAGLASKAVETLERLMESDQPSVALGAAKAVSELGPRLRESTEFEERINRLEEDEPDEKIDGNQTPAGEDELIGALAAGATVREAAEQAGVEERTAQGRLADADFRRAVSQARGRLFDSALGRLAGLASRAAGIFERLMESDQPSVARRAAKAVLVLGPRLRESTEFEERISRLEEEADEREKHPPKVVIIDNNPWYGEEGGRRKGGGWRVVGGGWWVVGGGWWVWVVGVGGRRRLNDEVHASYAGGTDAGFLFAIQTKLDGVLACIFARFSGSPSRSPAARGGCGQAMRRAAILPRCLGFRRIEAATPKSVHPRPRVCQSLPKSAILCQSLPKSAILCQSLPSAVLSRRLASIGPFTARQVRLAEGRRRC